MTFFSTSECAIQPIVTVVIPAYNHACYLIEAIDSVRNQTFQNWALIVIDDGSTDETWACLNEYITRIVDPRISIYRQINAGSHATLNRGLNMASSPYLAVLNSDDRYQPDRLEKLVQIAEAAHGDVFIATGVSLIDGNGLLINKDHWWLKMYQDLLIHWHDSAAHCENPAVQTLLWGNFTVSTSNFFLSRKIWQHVGPLKHLRYVLDWDFALRVASEYPKSFIFVPNDQSLEYRLHGRNTILGGALRNHTEAFRVLRTFQKKWVTNGHQISGWAVDRLHYLSRFIRHEHTRQMLEQQKSGYIEHIEAITSELHATHIVELQVERMKVSQLLAEATQMQEQVSHMRDHVSHMQEQVRQIQSSRSWRITSPIRRGSDLFRKILRVTKRQGAKLLEKLKPRTKMLSAYQQWLKSESIMINNLQLRSEEVVFSMGDQPLISIVMPVHDTPVKLLQAAIDSVRSQIYDRWELCICNDASVHPATVKLLNQLEVENSKIKIIHRVEAGHIVLATNDAIQMAQGKYVVFLDHDDQLAPHALLRLVETINAKPEVDFIYSDEDKLDAKGHRCLPFFKPDWSPVLLWSQNYIGHVMCIRRSLVLTLGCLKPGTQGSQDHDLVLRLANHGAKIEHLSEVLYHWQMHEASTSANPQSKPYAHQAGKDAVTAHLAARYGDQFDRVDDSDYTFVYQPRFNVPSQTLASIIIPTRDHVNLLKDCLNSIRQLTRSIQYEIIVMDNNSNEPATHSYFKTLVDDPLIRVIDAHVPFNWSLVNNLGRQHANGQILVFLNNDTKVITADWLLRLAEYALLPDVATVGPMLLYPDDTIQHAGVVVGMGGWADHVFKGELATHYPSPFVSNVLPRNVLANTGACVAISTQRFDQLGGFDEAFEICGSDVELGIRAHNQGYQNVYLPSVQLYHLESKTRSSNVPENDFEQSALKYAPYRLAGDPFFNANLAAFSTSPTPLFPVKENLSKTSRDQHP